jgi:hypothetical protein
MNGAAPTEAVGAMGRAGYREEWTPSYPAPQGGNHGAQAATAGSPTPITFSRRESAVKANSFISWLE